MTVFVGCPEGCRYHTASAVYDLVYNKPLDYFSDAVDKTYRSALLRIIMETSFIFKIDQNYRLHAHSK